MSRWLSIDSAPKDGSRVLAWRKDWTQPCFVRWIRNPRTETEFWNDAEELDCYENETEPPTHWIPLPEPTGEGHGMKNQEWHPITDDDSEIPSLGRTLVTNGWDIFIAEYYYHYAIVPPQWRNHTSPESGTPFDPKKLTHWMYLPELPGRDTQ